MKQALILLAGGMMGYGVFLFMKKRTCGSTAPAPAANTSQPAPALTMTETTEYVPAYTDMIGHYDARPEATFAPPKTAVALPGAGIQNMITNPYFGGKIVV